jgi:ABC-type multidrug transport system permease subunit
MCKKETFVGIQGREILQKVFIRRRYFFRELRTNISEDVELIGNILWLSNSTPLLFTLSGVMEPLDLIY